MVTAGSLSADVGRKRMRTKKPKAMKSGKAVPAFMAKPLPAAMPRARGGASGGKSGGRRRMKNMAI